MATKLTGTKRQSYTVSDKERWPGEEKKPACLWRVWSPRDRKSENSTDTRKHELSSNSWRINLDLAAAGCLFKQAV